VIDAPRVDELMQALSERFPALAPQLEQASVAIDGQIYHHARYEKLGHASDVHLLPPVAGGSPEGCLTEVRSRSDRWSDLESDLRPGDR
jgi:molybdopterin converting factor small subunit